MVACIKDADGNIAAAAMLMAPDPNSVAARRALQAAWAAWQGAKALVGRDDTDVDVPRAQAEHQAAKARAMGRFKWREPGISEQEKDRRRQQYNAAMEAPNAKLTKVRRKADAAHRAWRKEMVRHLLLVPDQEDPIVASIAEAGGDGPGETIVERQRRRLDRFRFFGGRMKKAGNTWHCTGGRRGALADLAVEEKEAGRPMSHRTNVADDLRAATEAENKASEDIRRS